MRVCKTYNYVQSRITEVRVIEPLQVELTFSDGPRGVVDIALRIGEFTGVFTGVFEPFKDPAFFARVTVDHDAGTIVWPNGADLDPDVLYEAAHANSGRDPRMERSRL